MSEDMVEHVAIALHARAEARRRARSVLSEYVPEAWKDLSPGRRSDFRLDARAAIDGMYRPTEEMEAAGELGVQLAWDETERAQAKSAYRKMIDAALNAKVPA